MGLVTCIDVAVPWALAALIGAVTAITGLYMSINSDFLSDLRFGMCSGLVFSDRNRCCGGADNINYATGRCKEPTLADLVDLPGKEGYTRVEWLPWEDLFPAPFAIYLVASVTYSALAALLVHEYSQAARGSGIPDVKAAVSGFSIISSFSAMCLTVKALALSLVVGAGLALGKEGPMIQLGVCWAYLLRARGGLLGALTSTVPLHEVVYVGAAAGVSTAFGAPVGGVLFAVEELGSVRALSQRALLLAFAGSFTASFVVKSWNLYGSNQLTFFKLSTSTNNPSKEWLTWEISLFLLLGIVGGLVGSLFIRLNLWVSRRRRRQAEAGKIWLLPAAWQDKLIRQLPACFLRQDGSTEAAGAFARQTSLTSAGSVENLHGTCPRLAPLTLHMCEVVIVAFLTALIDYPVTRILRLPMIEVIHGLFETCPHSLGTNLGLCDASAPRGFATGKSIEVFLVVSAAARLVQTSITFGAMLPAGLFIPSLYIGALLGRFVGLRTLELSLSLLGTERQTQINPSVFAMVGAVAMASGFSRLTVSLVVIMLELTGELNYAVPFMCAVLVAKLAGDTFTVSIYDGHAALLGFATIEEPKGLRLVPHISDVALPCGEADVLDISQPIPLEAVKAALAGLWLDPATAGGEPPEELGHAVLTPTHTRMLSRSLSRNLQDADEVAVPSAASDSAPGGVLILVQGAKRSEVYGVVERERLRLWLAHSPPPNHALCLFGGSDSAAAAQGPFPVADFRDLVDTGIRRLLSSAPVLTAVCAFREYPELSYCVCRTEAVDGPSRSTFSVLSRERLERALAQGRFAAAFRTGESSPGTSSPASSRRT